jgi:outer membrane protein TolC
MRKRGVVTILASASVGALLASRAGAQPAQPAPAGPPAVAPRESAAAAIAVEAPPVDLTRIEATGLTADQVGARAAATSFDAKAQAENLRAAAARVDQAWVNFLPRLTGTARYTRLSNFVPPAISLGAPGGPYPVYSVGSAPGTLGPTDTVVVDPNQAGGLSFPLVLDNYLLQASIAVPISDYFLRINQGHTAATNARDAANFNVVASRAKAGADGKIAYYTWLRARGAAAVSAQALNDQRTHLNDAKNQFAVGNASRADVLRAETAVAAAELQLERSGNLADLTEKQVHVAMHVPDDQRIVPGEGLDAPPPPFPGALPQLTAEAISNRPEVKSADANAAAMRETAKIQRAGAIPQIAAFGDAIYANPNQRRFPQTNEWFPTWDVGIQATWSPNDLLTGKYGSREFEARAAAIEAQRGMVRDGIELEVMQAWQAIKEADVALESTKRELASATEAYRVARELFNNGRAISTTLTDAETELTRARLDALNAAVDAKIARVRLEHALGRDARLTQAP